jgi:hypothetical protein
MICNSLTKPQIHTMLQQYQLYDFEFAMSYRTLPSFVSDPLSRSENKIIDCVVGK